MKKPVWKRRRITTADGTRVEAIEPIVISASRATDIPALHPGWLIDRFTEGYTVWINPFNGKPLYIALDSVRVIAFWSKNPQPLLRHLDFFDRRNIGYFFHLTVNDYEHEGFEPGIPALSTRLKTVRQLSALLGKRKIIWRFDPIIITPDLSPATIIERIERVGDSIAEYVDRLTVSFLSHYPKVVRTLKKYGVNPEERRSDHIAIIGQGLRRLSRKWRLPVVTCAESADLADWGILPGRCIDPHHLLTTFPEQAALVNLITGHDQPDLFPPDEARLRQLKDPGQRERCGCMISKDIGRYGTCGLGCRYCYAGGGTGATTRL